MPTTPNLNLLLRPNYPSPGRPWPSLLRRLRPTRDRAPPTLLMTPSRLTQSITRAPRCSSNAPGLPAPFSTRVAPLPGVCAHGLPDALQALLESPPSLQEAQAAGYSDRSKNPSSLQCLAPPTASTLSFSSQRLSQLHSFIHCEYYLPLATRTLSEPL